MNSRRAWLVLAVTAAVAAPAAAGPRPLRPGGAVSPYLRGIPPAPPPTGGNPTRRVSWCGTTPNGPAGLASPPTPSDPPAASSPPPPATTPAPTGPAPATAPEPTPNPERARRSAPSAWNDWTGWYHGHADLLGRPPRASDGTRSAGLGDGVGEAIVEADSAVVVPAGVAASCARLLDSAADLRTDAVAAGLAALARTTDRRESIDLLVAATADAPGAQALVREKSALALGLLRRSDPERRFAAGDLDRVRDRLLAIAESPAEPDRVRVAALLALGLLADQPFAGASDLDRALRCRSVGERLFAIARADAPAAEIPATALVALALGGPGALGPDSRRVLAATARGWTLRGHPLPRALRPFAILALGAVVGPDALPDLAEVVGPRGDADGAAVRAAVRAAEQASIGAGSDTRVRGARLLVEVAEAAADEGARHGAILALGRLLAADRADGAEEVRTRTDADETLLRIARQGRPVSRPFAALGLALAVAADGDPAPDALRTRALERLREGLADRSLDGRGRGGFAVALGIAGDGAARRALIARARGEVGAGPESRAWGLVALGHLGAADLEVRALLVASLSTREPEAVRTGAALAASLLPADPATLRALEPSLLGALLHSPEADPRFAAALALSRLGSRAATPRLVETLEALAGDDPLAAERLDALALVADPEPVSSLARLAAVTDHLAPTVLLGELYGVR